MSKPKLTYFDAPVSRGEECRLALHCAGVDFEDVRIKRDVWPAMKPTTPYGGLPLFEIEGRPTLAQSNAILVYIGRTWGLHPKDDFEAARHEAMLCHLEELRTTIGATLRIADEAEKKKAREQIVASYLPTWAAFAEKQCSDGPFFAGEKLHVVDIKMFVCVRWLASGTVDHIPATVLAGAPKLTRIHDAVRDDARVKAWHAKR
jgi:glutathione S-transferase